MTSFPSLATAQGLKSLNDHLLTRSYISGFQSSRDDLAVFSALASAPSPKEYPHAARWYSHISALVGSSFPGTGAGVTIEGTAATTSTAETKSRGLPAVSEPPKAEEEEDLGKDVLEDDDEDLDLFGEQTEEEKKAAAEKKALVDAKKKKAAEKAKLSKSMIIIDVKPWDDTTDLKEMENYVRSIQKDGLLWGQCKQVPVGFGIKKLQMNAVIEDAKVESFDIIIEDDLMQDGENPFIQSVDIVAFNKL